MRIDENRKTHLSFMVYKQDREDRVDYVTQHLKCLTLT